MQRGQALGLKCSGSLREAVQQDRGPSRIHHRRGIPRARQLHAILGGNRNQRRSLRTIVGRGAGFINAGIGRELRPGRHDQRPAPNSMIASSTQATIPIRKPASPMRTLSTSADATQSPGSSVARKGSA